MGLPALAKPLATDRPDGVIAPGSADRPRKLVYVVGVAVLTVVGTLCAITWPIAAVFLAFVIAVCLVAARAPALGVIGALLLAGAQGLIKARFTAEGVPHPEALVGGGLDLLLLGTSLNLLVADRGRSLRAVWRRTERAERVAWGLVLAWLVISVLQIPESGSVVDGVKGFRLSQAYVPLVLTGVALYPNYRRPETLTRAMLWIFAILTGYAALRGITGPSSWELNYALSRTQLARLGGLARDIGSFASPQELAGYLAPAAVFAFIIGALDRRVRLLAGVTFVLAAFAILESYGAGGVGRAWRRRSRAGGGAHDRSRDIQKGEGGFDRHSGCPYRRRLFGGPGGRRRVDVC